MAWHSTENDPSNLATNIFGTVSNDGGTTWQSRSGFQIDNNSFAQTINDYVSGYEGMGVHPTNVPKTFFPAWCDERSGLTFMQAWTAGFLFN